MEAVMEMPAVAEEQSTVTEGVGIDAAVQYVHDAWGDNAYAKWLRPCAREALGKLHNRIAVIAAYRHVAQMPPNFFKAEDMKPVDPTWCTGWRHLFMKLKEAGETIATDNILAIVAFRELFNVQQHTAQPSESLSDKMFHVNAAKVNELLDKFGCEHTLEYIEPAVNLITTFGGKAESFINAFIKTMAESDLSRGLHDAGQFSPVKLSGQWQDFFVARPSLAKRFHRADIVEQILGKIPSTVEEYEQAIELGKEQGLIPATDNPVFDNMSDSEREEYEEFLEENSACPVCWVPFPGPDIKTGVSNDKYQLVQLLKHDPLNLAIGEAVNCCQHLNGAGSSCAKATFKSPMAATWVCYRNGEISSEAYVWRNGNTLVLDSVEGFDHNGNVELFKTAAEDVIGKLGIERVVVSSASSGITHDVRELAGNSVGHIDGCPSSYTDARGESYLLAGTVSENNPKWVPPAEEQKMLDEYLANKSSNDDDEDDDD